MSTDKTQSQRDRENEAYKEGLNNKDYTWTDGFIDAITFKNPGGYSDSEKDALQRVQLDRERIYSGK